MEREGKKRVFVKSFSFLISLFILGLLILSGPARAFVLSLDIPDNEAKKGDIISFTGSVDIQNNENLPIDNLILRLEGPETVSCLFAPDGSLVSGCKGITIQYLGNASFEQGNGYGYYGYGYDFGYGYGYSNGLLLYNFTLNTTTYSTGNYSTELSVNVNGNSFSNTGDDIVIINIVTINNVFMAPSCAYDNENITVSAEINGSVAEVLVETEIEGVFENYTTTNLGDIYSAVIQGIGGKNLSWRFAVKDVLGEMTYSVWETNYIIHKTSIMVNPLSPDGLNGWYITEPIWTLTNPDANQTWYKWNGDPKILYTNPFGLENIPNPDKESAGTMKLRFWSDTDCGMEEWNSVVYYVDLTDPVINDLLPINGSDVNNYRPTISAYLDDVYQSNSGIDDAYTILKVDGVEVTPIVTEYELDRRLVYNPQADLAEGWHEVYVYARDKAGRDSEITWNFKVNITSLADLTVYMPPQGYYDSRRVPFNITTNEPVKLEYINYNDVRPRWRTLCSNCDDYGFSRKKTKSLREGENNITIRSTDSLGLHQEYDVFMFIDSRKPRISKVEPRRNAVVNGSEFYIKYTENNLQNITLYWEGNTSGSKVLDNCISGRNQECVTFADLTGDDGEWIEYWFEVSDVVRIEESRKTRIKVDTTSPELTINSPFNETYGRRVPFNISISEDVMLEYLDEDANNPRWRRLCSNCDDYGFTRKKLKSFRRGVHNLLIRAVDKAGNSDMKEVSFEVDY